MTSKWSFKWDKMFFLIILFLGCFSSPLISYELFFPIQASNKVPTIPLEKPIARSPNGVKIVASISIAGDFVQKVVGDLATVSTIVSGLENPHTFEPTSGDIDTIATCDLFVKMGVPGLESWVDDITAAYPDITTVEACNLATMMEYDSIIGAKNPHVWMSPLIAKEMVERIYTEVITIDAQNANNYQINKNSYITELDALHQRILANRSIFQSRKVVVHHPSFKYLFDLLGIDRIAAIEEHEGGEPSAEHIAEIVDTMKEQDVKLIINQPQLSADQVNQIARDTGAKIADLTPLLGVEDQNGDPILDYISMIEYNLWALVHPHNPPLESSSPIIWFGLGITVISIAVAIITIILRMRPRSIE